MSAAALIRHKPKAAGSIVFGSGTTAPFVIGRGGASRPLVDGWYLDEFEDVGDDCVKLTYEAVNIKTGARVDLNWSPYKFYSDAQFAAMVAMGFPKGIKLPEPAVDYRLYPDDVDALYAAHLAQGGNDRRRCAS